MTKSELRKYYLELRLNLSKSTADELCNKIIHQFIEEINLTSVRLIHIYLPIKSKNEINTFKLIDAINIKYPCIQFVVPVIKNKIMESVKYQIGEELIANKWGILEPLKLETVNQIPDLVITPLLAFDQDGNRVGYGGGFYDRFFEELPLNVSKIGLSFFESIDTIDDLDVFDIPLDVCITPKRIYDFAK